MLMNYYLVDEYFNKVLEIYNNIDSDKYYVQMGIAWGISVAFVKNEEKTYNYREYFGNRGHHGGKYFSLVDMEYK